jgi:hypothetical protein
MTGSSGGVFSSPVREPSPKPDIVFIVAGQGCEKVNGIPRDRYRFRYGCRRCKPTSGATNRS